MRRLQLALFGALAGAASCQVFNRLDVCHDGPASRGINERFDGHQVLGSPEATGRLPNGDSLVVFVSQVGQRSVDEALELRAARFSPEGTPRSGCASNQVHEDTIAAVDPLAPAPQLRGYPAVATPALNEIGQNGLLVYGSKEGGESWTVKGQIFDVKGCARPTVDKNVGLFTIAETASDVLAVGSISIARIGDDAVDDNRFVVAWLEFREQTTTARARLVRARNFGPIFMPTEAAPDGSAVELPLNAHIAASLQVVRAGPDRVAIAWIDSQLGTERPAVTFFDGFLKPTGVAVWVDDGHAPALGNRGRYVAAAFDGAHLLVTWTRGDAKGRPRLVTRALDLEGRPRTAAPLQVGAAGEVSDVNISVAGMPDGGFLTTWRQGSDAPGAAAATLRLAALDTDGALAFNNSACAERDVAIIEPRPGADFGQTGFNVGADGSVILAFTALGSGWDDPDGSSIRAISFTEKSLFPAGHPVGPSRRAGPALAPLPPIRIPTEGVCAGAGAGQPGLPCKCDGSCAPGGRCLPSSTGGTPGGFCYQDCAAGDDASCGANGMCSVVGTAARGICFAACQKTADCPAGRACDIALGECVDFCVSDEDCEPNALCDPYQRICVATASAGGGGLFDACRDGVECRSRHCGTSSYTKGRCVSYCRKDVAPCPENGVCIPLRDGSDYGRCYRPCPEHFCLDADLVCYPLSPQAPEVCVAY